MSAGTTDDQRVRAVVELLATLSGGRYDEVELRLTPDAVFHAPYLHGSGPGVEGGPAVAAMLRRFLGRSFDPLSFTIDRIHLGLDPSTVVVEYRSAGLTRVSGAPYANTYVGIFEVRDGRIALWREFFDPRQVDLAFGPPAKK
jgi:ketosteroid isomerase-like protein